MRFSVLLAEITIAWISVTIDAAAVMKKQSKHLDFRKMSKNIRAMSAEDERFSACDSRMDMFQVQSVSSNEHLCLSCKACIDTEGILRVPIVKGATVRLQVSKFFFKVMDRTYDLCALLDTVKKGPRCPIEPKHNGLRACLPLDQSLTIDVI
ncbi:hypothetical protein BGZ81_002380 [Podila clonocystis]|nr:hypothetical protein BGZ81_002380 [Podila clonocystis]